MCLSEGEAFVGKGLACDGPLSSSSTRRLFRDLAGIVEVCVCGEPRKDGIVGFGCRSNGGGVSCFSEAESESDGKEGAGVGIEATDSRLGRTEGGNLDRESGGDALKGRFSTLVVMESDLLVF